MEEPKTSSRKRLLDAADALAREVGPAHLSLDAVAARAGLSKGGLLYNFPTKAKLLEALVEAHIERAEAALLESESACCAQPNGMALAYLDHFCKERRERPAPASGMLAAIVEHPQLIDPIRRHQRVLLDRLKTRSEDTDLAFIAFLVIEGLRCQQLLDSQSLEQDEVEQVLSRLGKLLSEQR
ncbi:MAG TPA: TetR/AcrR family transcriptional regulator [Saliniramus sp.]|nr:TetR/AcrR family transcriptional regulator [Saliniramus sp.]